MKKVLLFLLVLSMMTMVANAQSSRVSKVTSKDSGAPEPPHTDNRFVFFDGYQNDLNFGMGTKYPYRAKIKIK